MDFSFYIGFSRDVGMTLFDIKFKGERLSECCFHHIFDLNSVTRPSSEHL